MIVPLPFERLIKLLARLPGLGPRSAQRMALHLLTKPQAMADVQRALDEVAATLHVCRACGNLGVAELCHICDDDRRDHGLMCVVEGVDDIWALERASVYKGRYHVLGGVVSALDGIGPDQLRIPALVQRVRDDRVHEVILALGASVDGQTTAHIITERLKPLNVAVTTLAKGMPVGADVDYLDEGTLSLALEGRRRVA